MKTQIKNFALFSCLFVLSQQFMSCQKNNEVIGNGAHTSSVDNSINTLPIDSSLVAWYPFHHGQLVDKSGHGNKIVICTAAPVNSRSGLDSGAYYFDGSSSYMKVNNSSSLNPFQSITLAALVKPMGFYMGQCHYSRILVKSIDDFSNGRIELGFSDQRFYGFGACEKPVRTDRENFYGSYGDGSLATGVWDTLPYIKAGKWYTLIYTYDGATSKLYINNKLVASTAIKASFTANNTDLFIGKSPSSIYPFYFNGIIDEIRMYNKALSPDEVISLNTLMGE